TLGLFTGRGRPQPRLRPGDSRPRLAVCWIFRPVQRHKIGRTAMTALRRILMSACFGVGLPLALAPASASADTVRIYVTNSAGDSVHVIDPATNKVVQTFKGPEAMHGVAFAPDGSRVYISNEEGSTLDVFDRKSGKLIKQVALSNRPNNIAV